jgi:hypothetical protein
LRRASFMLVLRREWIEADIIIGRARTLEGRTFAAATGAYRPTGLR